MAMAILLSLSELDGQTPSSLEDDGIGHGHLHNSPVGKGGGWPWSSFCSSQEYEEETSSSLEDMP